MSGTRCPRLLLLILVALALSCGPREAEDPATSRRGVPDVIPPTVVERVEPELPKEVEDLLASSPETVKAVLHVAVSGEGAATDVRIVSAEPANLPAARAFAEAALVAVREWKFRPAMSRGRPVASEFDVTVEARGEDVDGVAGEQP